MKMPKILLIRFSSIGDIVLCSPIIRALRQQLSAEVHFLTKKNFAGLLTANPNLNQVHTLQEQISNTIRDLKLEQFDYVVDLHKNLRSRRITSALGLPVYRFDKMNWEKWLMVNLKKNKLGQQHLVDRYFSGIKELGVTNDHRGLDYYPNDKNAEKTAKQLITDFGAEAFFGLVLGAAHATKQMPKDLLQKTIAKSEKKLVLLGGPSEAALGQELALEYPNKVINLCGKTSIAESAEVIKLCTAVITPDTGMMHIAAALKIPVVAVWGNTIPEFGMYPYYPQGEEKYSNVAQQELSCRPCSKIGKTSCPKKHFNCMRKHSADDILQAAKRILD